MSVQTLASVLVVCRAAGSADAVLFVVGQMYACPDGYSLPWPCQRLTA